MVAYTKPQQRKKKESERLRPERDQIKFIDLRLKDGKFSDSGQQEEDKTFHKWHVLGMNGDLWDKIRRLGGETWEGCEWVELYFECWTTKRKCTMTCTRNNPRLQTAKLTFKNCHQIYVVDEQVNASLFRHPEIPLMAHYRSANAL